MAVQMSLYHCGLPVITCIFVLRKWNPESIDSVEVYCHKNAAALYRRFQYPHDLINTAIKRFVDAKLSQQPNMPGADEPDENIRITIPFIDQRSADVVRRKLQDLSHKINTTVQPVFVSRKLNESLKVQEKKPLIINQQRVVYNFKCDSCDASYVGYTYRHLHERIEEHKGMSSSI
ncbi:hypothetical protein QZH41_018391, partial [Actinostola sp. cb2023]